MSSPSATDAAKSDATHEAKQPASVSAISEVPVDPSLAADAEAATPSGSTSAAPATSTNRTGLTLGELYLLTRPATWDPSEEQPLGRTRAATKQRSGSVSEGSEAGRAPAPRSRGGRGGRRKTRTPYYVAQSDDEEDADGDYVGDYTASAEWVAQTSAAPRRGAASGSARGGGSTGTGRGNGVRFKCTYTGCDKSFTREGDRARHLATTLHRGELLSPQRIADIMAETRETHRQYCIRCKRIMLRVNSRRRHEENPGACGSRRGMPKDVIEGGRVAVEITDPNS
jgi:hypothetical protein